MYCGGVYEYMIVYIMNLFHRFIKWKIKNSKKSTRPVRYMAGLYPGYVPT